MNAVLILGIFHRLVERNTKGHAGRPTRLRAHLAKKGSAIHPSVRTYLTRSQASSKRFSPTRLATTLTSLSPPLPTSSTSGTTQASSGASIALTTGAGQQGFIVLETNYRIYAYTGKVVNADPFNHPNVPTFRQSPRHCCSQPLYYHEVPFPELGGRHAHA